MVALLIISPVRDYWLVSLFRADFDLGITPRNALENKWDQNRGEMMGEEELLGLHCLEVVEGLKHQS